MRSLPCAVEEDRLVRGVQNDVEELFQLGLVGRRRPENIGVHPDVVKLET